MEQPEWLWEQGRFALQIAVAIYPSSPVSDVTNFEFVLIVQYNKNQI